MFIKDNKERNV